MSKETQKWLDENTLIGFTKDRGNAWHWREGANNHFSSAVPLERVRQLFGWEPVTLPYTFMWEGNTRTTDRISVHRGDNGDLMGVFKDGYEPHAYNEWLVERVESILDTRKRADGLQIGSAGLLKNGAIAWVSVEVPKAIDIPMVGEQIRPSLTAATSFDGTVATTYKRLFTRIVCDNTFEMGMAEKLSGYSTVKVKHTRTSKGRLNLLTTQDALGIMAGMSDEIIAEVTTLAQTEVPKRKWSDFLDVHVPLPTDKGRGLTMAETKRDKLNTLYSTDTRVAPWAGTAWGVLQAVNTYNQHLAIVRGGERADRTMENAIKGKTGEADRDALEQLKLVLSN